MATIYGLSYSSECAFKVQTSAYYIGKSTDEFSKREGCNKTDNSTNTGQQRLALVRASSDLKTAQYVDVSCATAASSFDDSSEINLVVYR